MKINCKNFLVLAILAFSGFGSVSLVTAQPTVVTSTRGDSLLQQGKQLYDRGQFAAAAQIWERASRELSQNNQIADLIRSNNYLATVYQDLGQWDAAQNAIAKNLNLIATASPEIARRNVEIEYSALLQAQTLNTQGSLQLKQGQGEAALMSWQQSEGIYHSLEDTTGVILSQINQAQALQTLGFYRRSQKLLNQVQQRLDSLPDSPLKIAGLRSLGVTLAVSTGDLDQSQEMLEQSLSLAQQLNSASEMGETLFRLGNLARIEQNYDLAWDYYQQAILTTPQPQTQLEARLNQLSLLVEKEDSAAIPPLITQIQQQLAQLSPSRAKVYAQVNLAQSLIKLDNPTVETLLTAAIQEAQNLTDNYAQAYAVAELGHWHERNQDYNLALKLTNQALALTEAIDKTKINGVLHWQQGRILKAQGNRVQAIAAYQEAVTDLDYLHHDLVAVNSDSQFSFRQQVEPIYRQLVELLLQDLDSLPPQQKQQHLEQARNAIEALQQRELENFFRIACLDVKQQNIDHLDDQAAVIYPILLDNSVEVIISLPGQPLQHYQTKIDSVQQQAVFRELRQYLNPVFKSSDILPTAKRLYNWLIRPVEATLQEQEITTLVFVLGGKLSSLPMNVLHDGEKYLIEQYNLAVTPGLRLFPSSNIGKQNVQILTGGLTEARQGFSPLPGVAAEIKNISETVPTQVLLNQEFTNPTVQEEVAQEPFSIVHFATHGQFSSNAEDTFILTWSDRIKVKDFEKLLSQRENNVPIELLVLSACKTAKGDERAILGLAGIAVRSGARSTLATLWSVNDSSTAQLMTEFYRLLNQPQIKKAEALRQAQLSLLQDPRYRHPYYWSAFILVGNWR